MNPQQVFHGIGVGSMAAVGRCIQFAPSIKAPADEPVPTGAAAQDQAAGAIGDALAAVADDLDHAAMLHEEDVLGEVLAATAEIARDPELRDQSVALMRSGVGPANAVTQVVAQFADTFTQIGGYMAERVSDLNSVRDRVIARILGAPEQGTTMITEPSIIIAEELTPADTSGIDMSQVLGLVTVEGGPTSHTAIIARQHGLPYVVQAVGATSIADGSLVAVDSQQGTVTVNPEDEIRDAIGARMARRQTLLADTRPGATADGHPIQLLANIGTVEDAERASQLAVEGVGLFRTEFMFLDANEEPSIETQFSHYRRVLEQFQGRKVVVRTLDAGADKALSYANTQPEQNPALGVRAYRLVRSVPHLLDNQLKALSRAIEAVPDTDTWVMAPMISTSDEASDFADRAHAADIATVGIMIEVPAVALTAHHVLNHVDFASLGTNDLAQYTMATDRQLGSLSDLLDRWQPAVLRLVAESAKAAAALGKPIGVCGESASDPLMALVLCGLGVTSLSMSPAAVGEVRYALRNTTLAKCQHMARTALTANSAHHAMASVTDLLNAEVKETLGVG